MCGICGFISKKCISLQELKYMNDTMYHRGPNDSGAEIFEGFGGYYVGLAQRRLSILDLSMLGHQPMHSANDRLVITYNGEIYNFLEDDNTLITNLELLNVVMILNMLGIKKIAIAPYFKHFNILKFPTCK